MKTLELTDAQAAFLVSLLHADDPSTFAESFDNEMLDLQSAIQDQLGDLVFDGDLDPDFDEDDEDFEEDEDEEEEFDLVDDDQGNDW